MELQLDAETLDRLKLIAGKTPVEVVAQMLLVQAIKKAVVPDRS
jgi:hypothetical protein